MDNMQKHNRTQGRILLSNSNYIPLIKKMCYIAPASSILTIMGQFFSALFPAFITVIMAHLAESVAGYLGGADNRADILLTQGILILVYFIQQGLQFMMSITVNAGVYEKCNSEFKNELAQKSSRIPLISYEDSDFLNMYARAKECIDREEPGNIFMVAVTIATSFLSVLTVMGVLASYSVWFLPISVVSVLPFSIARKLRGDEFYRLKLKQTKDNRDLHYLWGLFTQKSSAHEMRVMGFEDYIVTKWISRRDTITKEVWEHDKKEAKSMLVCDIIRVLGYIASIVLAIALLLQGIIAIGPFAACLEAFASVQNATKEFLVKLSDIRNHGSFLKDYFDFMAIEEEKDTVSVINDRETVDIVLRDVTFSYPNASGPAVKDVSLSIEKGEKIAIIGENGSGKTTLCKLILGLYQPQKGQVYQSERVYGKCGIVSQTYVRYKLSLRENIGISNPANLEDGHRIRELIGQMDISELIHDKEDIDYRLGTEFGGVDLSGGQWQKTAIARAVYSNAAMYLLDEPTSALDPLIELSVMNSFLKMAADKTTVMVLHRMGLCKSVDRIIVMKDGEIAEMGSHAELMEAGGEYYRLYREQSKWYQCEKKF